MNNMNTKLLPFDIEKIKAGAQCVTRDGRQAILHEHESGDKWPYGFAVSGGEYSWTNLEGRESETRQDSPLDIFILDTTPEPESPWISVKDRMPTEEDVDSKGEVICWSHATGSTGRRPSQLVARNPYAYWMRTPPLPKPKRDFQKEILENIGTNGLFIWNQIDAEQQAEIKAKWEAENK